jgi:hypothetical protein
MPSPSNSLPSTALFVVAVILMPGCGKGLFDRTILLMSDARAPTYQDSGNEPDNDASPDAGTADAITDADVDASVADAVKDVGNDADSGSIPVVEVTTKTVDDRGDDLYLAEAHLIIGPGTFRERVSVTLRRITSVNHAGAVGPVFEISVPSSGLFRQDATLTLQVTTDIGQPNQSNLVLGILNPNLSLAMQQWVPAASSKYNPEPPSVTGLVTGFGNSSVLQFAAVILCVPTTTCPTGQSCNAGACNQCPTGSPCPM